VTGDGRVDVRDLGEVTQALPPWVK